MHFGQQQDGWVSLRIGEPCLVFEALADIVGRNGPIDKLNTEYPMFGKYPPEPGLKELIDEIRDHHRTDVPVVITAGATQGLNASLFALKRFTASVGIIIPYYPRLPSFAIEAGLTPVMCAGVSEDVEASVITSPNNPDGRLFDPDLPKDKIVIHDAVYQSGIYSVREPFESFGNVEIRSMSKAFGLPGSRVGYVLCHDRRFFDPIVDYVERTTSGVSTLSQYLAAQQLQLFNRKPHLLAEFHKQARDLIDVNRKLVASIPNDVLGPNEATELSMFSWHKKGLLYDEAAAKVQLLDGAVCGSPGMVRLNLAALHEDVAEAVMRLRGLR